MGKSKQKVSVNYKHLKSCLRCTSDALQLCVKVARQACAGKPTDLTDLRRLEKALTNAVSYFANCMAQSKYVD